MVKNLTRLRANQEKQKPFIKKEEETELDLFNGYGFRLLPETDITFNTPEFKAELLKYTLKQQGAGFSEKLHFHTVLTLGKNFIFELQKAVDYDLKRVKSKSKFSVRMHSFFQTGSDANNHLYQIANKTEVKRKSSTDSNFNPPEKEILFLSGIYGAGRGKMSKAGMYGHDTRMDKWIVKSPTVNDIKHISAEELIEVKKIEQESLKDIREKIDNVEMNVGGIFIEPVLGSKGVLFYRTEFLLNVQKLAEEYNIPIFVDEILAGGGRTGRIFSFMHYEGFVPDYITYGKGMQIAGILKVRKGYSFAHADIESDGRLPTLAFQPEAMVRSIAFLKAVNTRKLTAHAEAVGEYFKQELKKRAKKPEEVRGAGLMLFAEQDIISDFSKTRILPNLTIEKKDIDHLLKNIENINP